MAAATQFEPSQLVTFYMGESRDSEGRLIDDIWSWDDERLEYVHDYIQWLFPLPTRSAFNDRAPILTRSDIEQFQASDLLQARLRTSLLTLLRFYGLRLHQAVTGDRVVEPDSSFVTRRGHWLTPHNHNHLRLTRILTSCSLLGLRPEAETLQRCLLDLARQHPSAVSPVTVGYWERALSAPEAERAP